MRKRPQKPAAPAGSREPRYDVRPGKRGRSFRVAVIHVDTGDITHATPTNLNTSGCFVQCGAPYPKETEVSVSAIAHAGTEELRFTIRGWVAYQADGGMGIQFDGVAPEVEKTILRILELFRPGNQPPA
ncbi:MAG: hypothetical protein ACE5FN_09440 [Leptospirillia bacterium]